jgi:phosphate:Na+ symporter
MGYIYDFLVIVGSLGLFLLGMKMMSEGLQNVAGEKMRSILASMTTTRVAGVLTGLLITSIIQSSSATTVMVVSFVNAGLLPLAKSVGVILGANIGTTITAWIITLFGFKVQISALSLPIIGLAFPFMFTKGRSKMWAEVAIGFAILFIGLDFMKSNVPDIKNNPEVLEFITNFNDLGYVSVLIFVVIGMILTMIIQSSSAVVALTIVMCYQGWLSFELATSMVLGDNIGTTITANISALVANRTAKHAALIHFIFNVFGVLLILPFLFPVLRLVNSISMSFGNASAFESVEGIPVALSIFHSFFNITNTSIFIWFVPQLVRIAERIIPNKTDDDEVFQLRYISAGLMDTPNLSVVQAGKEVALFGGKAEKMVGFVDQLYKAPKDKKTGKLIRKIVKYEEITDRLDLEISEYLKQIEVDGMGRQSATEMHTLLKIIDNLECIGDVCYQISEHHERRVADKIDLPDALDEQLSELSGLVKEALKVMNSNLNKSMRDVRPDEAHEIEKRINAMRKTMREQNLDDMRQGKYDYAAASYFKDNFNALELIGDYVYDVTCAMADN